MKPEMWVERELLQFWTLLLLSLKAPVLYLSRSRTSTNSSKVRILTVTMFSSKGTAVCGMQDLGTQPTLRGVHSRLPAGPGRGLSRLETVGLPVPGLSPSMVFAPVKGLACVPHKKKKIHMSKSKLPKPQSVTLFGNGAIEDMISHHEVIPEWGIPNAK